MYKGKSILAVIPARGGSKGVPDKNIRDMVGKPLIAWSIERAKKSRYIDKLIVSSDSQRIIDAALSYGCEAPFVRPSELAGDDTPGVKSLVHAIEMMPEKYDYAILLQCTSPFRTENDIDGAIVACIDNGVSSCISVCESRCSPYQMLKVDNNGRIMPLLDPEKVFLPRQKLPKTYEINGAIYMIQTDTVLKTQNLMGEDTVAYVMSADSSLDINDIEDFYVAEAMIKAGHNSSTIKS